MTKKWLNRALISSMILIGVYFAFLNTGTESVPIEKVADGRPNIGEETILGKDVFYRSFDAEGNELVSGTSETVTVTGGEKFELEDGLELTINRDGRSYHFKADHFHENSDDRSRVMSVETGNLIKLRVADGVTIETPGPLIYTAEGIVTTEAPAVFSLGEMSGSCTGLRYLPETFLEMKAKARFDARNPDGRLHIEANFLYLDLSEKVGQLRSGSLEMTPSATADPATLDAQSMDFAFAAGKEGDFLLTSISFSGQPASFRWSQGLLTSSVLVGTCDPTGRMIERLETSADTRFRARTEDGLWLLGETGPLTATFEDSKPKELKSQDEVHLYTEKENGERLELRGKQGVATQFLAGEAYSTRIFGEPTFNYGRLEGRAGTLRLLHGEHKLLFSQGAELADLDQGMSISGDELLLTDWDQEEKEIFAFRFVKIRHQGADGQVIDSTGDKLELRLPQRYARLEGAPAQIRQQDQVILANTIEINPIDENLVQIQAKEAVSLRMPTEEGELLIGAQTLFLDQESRLLNLEKVEKAVLPSRGELTASFLTVTFGEQPGPIKDRIEHLAANGDVFFKGLFEEEGQTKSFTCSADKLSYANEEALIHFTGIEKDVVISHPSGEHRGRELTYDLNNGSMRVDSMAHGFSRTTVNLDQEGDKKNLP